ncbi:acetoin utilization protein AcuC [Sulfuriferula thiophila]|uniref:acetoin utilization protein AcuC n=1 Tax=Sulfuriferula thiophila TaxID=1781211 RepID=UPI000F60A53F|nr:acetoin utilization protein AcuC [Sulfuriferula thiophila]
MSNPQPTRNATYIGGPKSRRKAYGSNHPLAIPRVSLATDLIEAYGAMTEAEFMLARKAADFELEWFHTPEYVSAFKRAEALGRVSNPVRQRHQLGTLENPYFPQFFTIPATATGASIQAAEEVIRGRIAFNPAGGMHHARPDQAHGFCYFNDPVLGILRLRREGWRVLYVDIDAHHGDGVEAAFVHDPEVFTLSLHMDSRYAYPFQGGQLSDTASAGNTSLNVPLPKGTHDAEYRLLFDAVWQPVLDKFQPDAIVLQAGTDMIFADPLGKLGISTQGFLATAQTILETCPQHADGTPRLLVTGGGGYHPLVLARAWAGLWALLSGRELPETLPPVATAALRAVDWDMDEDEPHFEQLFSSRVDALTDMSVRPEIADLILSIQQHPFLHTP